MNEHLDPVFNILLPELERATVDYWIYGGVSIAACAGRFIRSNKDVDVFVEDVTFENAATFLKEICDRNKFDFEYCKSNNPNRKPKVNIYINFKERMSMIPIYQQGETVEFRYPEGNEEYSKQILERVERNISGYRFFTPRNEYIKQIFINHIKARPDKKKRENFQIDAKSILNKDEFTALGWHID